MSSELYDLIECEMFDLNKDMKAAFNSNDDEALERIESALKHLLSELKDFRESRVAK